jgi:hypothetical protein
MCHPFSTSLGFDYSPDVQGEDTIRDLRRYTGIEAWNGGYTSSGNVRSREAWDKVNAQGTGHYNGIAVSDAHSSAGVGSAYIKALMPVLSTGNIHSALKSGAYVGSNGPDIRFDIDGVGIAGALNIKGSSRMADFNIHAYNAKANLTKLEIIKNTITGKYELNREVVYSYAFTGEKTNAFDKTIRLEVKPDEFYRVEVSSSGYYAFTNNIWVGASDKSNATNLSNVLYSGDGIALKTQPTGLMYLSAAEGATLDLDKLTATVADGATLEKSYDTGTGSLILSVTAEDGTKSNTELYVLGAISEMPFEAEGLTMQPGASASGINFNWYSNRDAGSNVSAVRITKASGSSENINVTGTTGNASADKSWHKVSVTGLARDTVYNYSVSNDGVTFSRAYSFKTGAEGAFQFVTVGDPQLTTGNQDSDSVWPNPVKSTREGWADTMGKISQYAPNAAFMAGTGDQVDTATDEVQYTNYFAPEQLRSLPVAPAVGNHEGSAGNFSWHFNPPNETNYSSKTDAYGNYWYTYNNALFVVLNTAPYPNSTTEAAPYIAIMDSTLKAATEATPDYQWLFVQHHKSTASPASHQTDSDIIQAWAPEFNALMDKYNVDFVLAGHDHVYSRSWVIKDNKKVDANYSGDEITNPEGVIYFTLSTASGLKYYDFLQNPPAVPAWVADTSNMYTERRSGPNVITGKPWYTNVGIQVKAPQFTTVDVSDSSVTFKTYRTDTMAVIDKYTINKTTETGKDGGKASIRVNGLSAAAAPIEVTASLREASNVMAVALEFEVDGNLLSYASLETLNGFTAMNGGNGVISWTDLGNDTYKGKVTLVYKAGTGESLTSAETIDIAKFIYSAKGLGDATMKLTKLEVSGLVDNKVVWLDSEIEYAEATTSIVDIIEYSMYDLNKDGSVDQLDLTIVMLYCQFLEEDAEWNTLAKVTDSKGAGITASMCDFNEDGKINMLDLVELFLNYSNN